MPVSQWIPRAARNGVDQLSPVMAVPDGATLVYVQIDVQGSDFSNPAETLAYQTYWSSDPAIPPADASFQPLAGGTFTGGPVTSKTGVRFLEVPLPPGCTYVRAWYAITNGPIRFGLSGEFR